MKKTNNESIDFAVYLFENYTKLQNSDLYKYNFNDNSPYTIEEIYEHFTKEYSKVKYTFKLEVEVDKQLDEYGMSNLVDQFRAFKDFEFYDGDDETCNVLNYKLEQI